MCFLDGRLFSICKSEIKVPRPAKYIAVTSKLVAPLAPNHLILCRGRQSCVHSLRISYCISAPYQTHFRLRKTPVQFRSERAFARFLLSILLEDRRGNATPKGMQRTSLKMNKFRRARVIIFPVILHYLTTLGFILPTFINFSDKVRCVGSTHVNFLVACRSCVRSG